MTQQPNGATGTTRAVILGGSLAGTLAAAALAPHFVDILILERDKELPDTAAPRPRLPQAAHSHMLWSGGADAIEALLPGTTDRWLKAGAHRVPIPNGMVSYSAAGWFRRWTETHYLIGASRDLIDWGIRTAALAIPNVSVRTGVTVTALAGSASKVCGVHVRSEDGEESVLDADLVVDATGRGSKVLEWLQQIGAPTVSETVVDAGVRYASRRYRAPQGAESDWPVIHIQADPREGKPGQVVSIIPIEDGQWHVSLSGTRGAEPSADESLFEEFAGGVRHPLAAEFLARAEPISDVVVYGRTANRQRRFDKAAMPAGFVVLGDAATSLNPVYGHGMSAAALGALALRDTAAKMPVTAPKFAARAQKAMARPAAAAWLLAVGQDRFYPGAVGKAPNLADKLAARYVHRLSHTAIGNFLVVKALTDVMTMQKPASVLGTPDVLIAAARGLRKPLLDGPALTTREQSILDREPLRRAEKVKATDR
ncbi:pyridine nucleotide-disulfide oxidoreductase [Streptomyces sp. NBC_00193]|uniref:pyridine nucleotide-disulfide oxidoreductase n=1 Tax=Streptomyces sp. NBC_00193 TaxID=2975675 RepID=UPI00225B7A17|nr:pyridine nucleotide-disulfide oxidoreductase [Streptomyces sp. NBC_00193]MCX5294888.1 pyridine nucleotide-disulfide oxidoreductase [Streptomyces sp. NBC_00193]